MFGCSKNMGAEVRLLKRVAGYFESPWFPEATNLLI